MLFLFIKGTVSVISSDPPCKDVEYPKLHHFLYDCSKMKNMKQTEGLELFENVRNKNNWFLTSIKINKQLEINHFSI